jgi:hypothetical protein
MISSDAARYHSLKEQIVTDTIYSLVCASLSIKHPSFPEEPMQVSGSKTKKESMAYDRQEGQESKHEHRREQSQPRTKENFAAPTIMNIQITSSCHPAFSNK